MEYPQYDYAVIGGDMRQVYLAEELAHHQNRVCCYALMAAPDERRYSDASVVNAVSGLREACAGSRCVIGPIPLSKNGRDISQNALEGCLHLDALLSSLNSGCHFFSGCIPESFKNAALEKGVSVHDLMEHSSLAYYNTIATAEGALCEAISRSPQNLRQSSCAVLGYGKCGRTLVQYLKALCCRVFVFSIDEQECAQAAVAADTAMPLDALLKHIGNFDFIFNTVPALIVTAEVLENVKSSATIIDIASAPGGVDFAEAQRLGITAALCLGLPGKYAPSSSAKAVKETIESLLSQEHTAQIHKE